MRGVSWTKGQRLDYLARWRSFQEHSGLSAGQATKVFLATVEGEGGPCRATLFNWRRQAGRGALCDARCEAAGARRRIARACSQLPLGKLVIVETMVRLLAALPSGREARGVVAAAVGSAGQPSAAMTTDGSASPADALNGL